MTVGYNSTLYAETQEMILLVCARINMDVCAWNKAWKSVSVHRYINGTESNLPSVGLISE